VKKKLPKKVGAFWEWLTEGGRLEVALVLLILVLVGGMIVENRAAKEAPTVEELQEKLDEAGLMVQSDCREVGVVSQSMPLRSDVFGICAYGNDVFVNIGVSPVAIPENGQFSVRIGDGGCSGPIRVKPTGTWESNQIAWVSTSAAGSLCVYYLEPVSSNDVRSLIRRTTPGGSPGGQ
jgi:hypothetical protein